MILWSFSTHEPIRGSLIVKSPCDILNCLVLFIIPTHGSDFSTNYKISNLWDVAVPLLSNLSTFYINNPILLCLSYFLLMFLITESSSEILFCYSLSFCSVLMITSIFWVFQKILDDVSCAFKKLYVCLFRIRIIQQQKKLVNTHDFPLMRECHT